MKRIIYFDNAATTRPYTEAIDAATPYMRDMFYNPGGTYEGGEAAHQAVEDTRRVIAETIGAEPEEIIFTSGGSESDNLAIKGVMMRYFPRGHIITTAVEHKAVLNACKHLEKMGFAVTYLQPDSRGVITAKQVADAIRPDTRLVSVMAANNEIGTMYPIDEIGEICDSNNIFFHVDAVQLYGHVPINVKEAKIDLLSASGHKFHGLKGCGFLYKTKDLELVSQIDGGSQEFGERAGTENVPAIVAMGVAAKMSHDNIRDKADYVLSLRDYMIESILREIPGSFLNGTLLRRLPGNVNMGFNDVPGEVALRLLDANGICASTGSACNSGNGLPSHVLTAIGLTEKEANSCLRFTLNEENTMEEINLVIDTLKRVIEQIRR